MTDGWVDCPSLGPGWKRREVLRKSGTRTAPSIHDWEVLQSLLGRLGLLLSVPSLAQPSRLSGLDFAALNLRSLTIFSFQSKAVGTCKYFFGVFFAPSTGASFSHVSSPFSVTAPFKPRAVSPLSGDCFFHLFFPVGFPSWGPSPLTKPPTSARPPTPAGFPSWGLLPLPIHQRQTPAMLRTCQVATNVCLSAILTAWRISRRIGTVAILEAFHKASILTFVLWLLRFPFLGTSVELQALYKIIFIS
ncbi:Methyl-CpG-binding domain protein 1, partial [Ophiophagus hannah]